MPRGVVTNPAIADATIRVGDLIPLLDKRTQKRILAFMEHGNVPEVEVGDWAAMQRILETKAMRGDHPKALRVLQRWLHENEPVHQVFSTYVHTRGKPSGKHRGE